MSKKKDNQEEPWSRRFGEDENYESRQYSRSARKSSKKEVAPLYKVLLFLFLALLIIPFATYYWHESTKTNPNPQTPDQVMINKQDTSSTAKDKAAGESSLADQQQSRREESFADAGTAAQSSAVVDNESTESGSEKVKADDESISSIHSDDEESDDETEEVDLEYLNTYTVKAGDNLFRIALNHGMDLDELKKANGLTSDVAEIGQELKVR